jgi:glutamyl-tRNA synthetase
MLLGTDRSKLSKRHGAVSITDYKEQGYLADAMFNFLSLLGWSLDDKTEIMTRQQIIKSFSLERVSQTAAIFNSEKLDWMNGVYIRNLSPGELTRLIIPFLERDLPPQVKRPLDVDYINRMTPLIQERIKTLAEAAELTDFFFTDELEYEPSLLIVKKMNRQLAENALEKALLKLKRLPAFDEAALEEMLRPLAEELELKTGQLFGTLRIAVTGKQVAPPLFQTMATLGRERCISRVKKAIAVLKEMPAESDKQ